MRFYTFGCIKIPKISSIFLKGKFKKKIPIVLVPLHQRYNPDYRENQLRFFPFTKDHPTVYDSPYMDQPPYYGIKTDIRYYDYINDAPLSGTKKTELY